jgi:hypothetical protein
MDKKESRPKLEVLKGGKPDAASAILKKVDRYILKAGNTDDVEWLWNTFQVCDRLLKEEDLNSEDEEAIKEISIRAVDRLLELEVDVKNMIRKAEGIHLTQKKEKYTL